MATHPAFRRTRQEKKSFGLPQGAHQGNPLWNVCIRPVPVNKRILTIGRNADRTLVLLTWRVRRVGSRGARRCCAALENLALSSWALLSFTKGLPGEDKFEWGF
jgi:hypothetical protein